MNGGGVQFYDFNLSAGGSQWLPASGAFYRVISATGQVVVIEDNGGAVGPINAGQGMRNRDFKALTIVDKSGASNKGVLIVAGSDFVDDRITGEVSTIDGGRARSIAGSAFVASFGPNNAAGTAAGAILWNPAGSGKRLIVKTSRISSTQAQFVGMARKNATQGALAPNALISKGNSTSAGQGYEITNVAPTADSGYMHAVQISANGVDAVVFQEPVIVEPGKGLIWMGNATTAGAIQVQAEFTEEAL